MKNLILLLLISTGFYGFISSTSYKVGDKVDDLKLQTVSGRFISLSDFKSAKGFMIVFASRSCSEAVAYEDRLMSISKKFIEKDYPLIVIYSDENSVSSKKELVPLDQYVNNKNFNFVVVRDDSQDIAARFGVSTYPEAFVVQKSDGNFILKYAGAFDNSQNQETVSKEYVSLAVKSLLSGEEIVSPIVPSLGCKAKLKKSN